MGFRGFFGLFIFISFTSYYTITTWFEKNLSTGVAMSIKTNYFTLDKWINTFIIAWLGNLW